jgi:hypothetical protein
MLRPLLAAALLAVALPAAPAASAQTVGLSARASTLGVGGDLSVRALPRLNVRATANLFSFAHEGALSPADLDVDGLHMGYDAELGLGSVGLLADWHPFGNTFRVTAGALYNVNEVVASLQATEPYYDADLDKTFSPEQVGTLRMEVGYEQPVAPYAALGLGNLTAGRFGLTLEAGAAYVGPPSVTITGDGLIGGTAHPANEAALERGLDSFRLHPVVSVGLKTSLGR